MVGDLLHDLGDALLEVPAEAGPRDHAGQVERDDAHTAQRLRDVAVHDALGEALDDRGLADAGLTDQHGVVLRAAQQDLDGLLDLECAPDHRVELARRRLRSGRGRTCRASGYRCSDSAALAHLPRGVLSDRLQRVRRDAERREQLSGRSAGPPHRRRTGAPGRCTWSRSRARPGRPRAASAARSPSATACRRALVRRGGEALLDRAHEPVHIDAGGAQRALALVGGDETAQQVQRVDLGVAVLERVPGGRRGARGSACSAGGRCRWAGPAPRSAGFRQ